jgi:metallo-beta-lactamase family protein
MILKFCGGAGAVTGVCYLLETGQTKILVDCGLFQGGRELEEKNYEDFSFDPREIDAVIVTHSHLDHVGRLPQLIKAGFSGKIFATPPTVDFTHLILDDSAKVLAEKAKKAGVVPLFSLSEVGDLMKHFIPVDYYKKTRAAEGFEFTFHDAGHILGSAIIELEAESKKIVFSGDIGNPPTPVLRSPDFLDSADYVVVESTYGDKKHEASESCKELIENVIEDAIARGGTLMIPSFAMERTQQLLYHLNDLVEHKRIPRVPIFIDSPLALRITEVYKKYPQYYNKQTSSEIKMGDDIFSFPGLRLTQTSKESKEINDVPPPKIIIAGSGMSQGGRIVHHEARYLPDEKSTLLQVTYQAEGTLGRKLADGAKEVEILDQKITVLAHREKISGYSAHADQKFLMEWLKNFQKPCYGDGKDSFKLKKIFVTQGEPEAAKILANLAQDELGVAAVAPEMGQVEKL